MAIAGQNMNTLRQVIVEFVHKSFSDLSPSVLNEEESLLVLLTLSVRENRFDIIR